jgi:outer membrane receptor protein involved in Fe transport
MRLCLTVFLCILIWTLNGQAQRPEGGGRPGGDVERTVRGTVTDAGGQTIPLASVVLRGMRDTTYMTGAATDMDGRFAVKVRPGKFTLKISFISFDDLVMGDVNTLAGDVDLGTLTLRPKSELIDEVTVTAEKGAIQLQLDKRVYNVDKDLSNRGSNAQDLLNNIPSVSVDVDGNVSLRGSQNVRILIDGKPSSLTGMSGSDALRRMPSGMIDRVELVTNASARNDAEGEAGIINIVLKKDRRDGLNGAIETSVGWPHNHSVSGNINYRQGKWNVFSNLGVSYRQNPGVGKSYQQFFQTDTTFSYSRDRVHSRTSYGGNFRLGTDWSPDAKTSVTVSGMYGRTWGDNEAELNYSDMDSEGAVSRLVQRNETERELPQNGEANLNLRRTFKVPEQLLTFDARWFYNEEFRDSQIDETSASYAAPLIQRVNNDQTETNYLLQTDYVHPFGKYEARIETGLKANMRQLTTDYSVEQQSDTGTWAALTQFSNNFVYDEKIYAGYVMGKMKVKALSMQAGVRAELSDIGTRLLLTDEANDWLYFNLFPSAHLSYELKKGNTLQLSYSRRISRPGPRELLPFMSLSDNRNIRMGNPDLQPEFTNSFELGHLKNWAKGTLLSSVYYRYRTGVRQNISEADSTGRIISFPVNMATQHAVGIEFNFSYELFRWWRFNMNGNGYYSRSEGAYEGQVLSVQTFSANGRLMTRFTIAKRLELQTSFNYTAPENTPQGFTKSMYNWDAGASIDVLKGNGTVSLSVRDILNTRKRRWETDTPEFHSESEFQWRQRQITATFTYRFNQKKRTRTERGSGPEGGGGGGMDEGF